MSKRADSCILLVRYHGAYFWGEIRKKARTMCECYNYWFINDILMKKVGLDLIQPPVGEEEN